MAPSTREEARAAEAATGTSQQQRFTLELEFVMALANPRYLHHLATNKYFEDPAFIDYLKYLRYWEQPQYAKFLHYPHALYFLDQLQRPEFRRAMENPRAVEHVFSQQFFFWQSFRTEQLQQQQQLLLLQQEGQGQDVQGVVGVAGGQPQTT